MLMVCDSVMILLHWSDARLLLDSIIDHPLGWVKRFR